MITKTSSLVHFTTLALTLALVSGCSVNSKKTINVSQPLTILTSEDKQQKMMAEDKIPRSIAVLPLLNETKEDIASHLLRSVIQNHFSSKNFQLVNWQEVDRQLSYSDNPTKLDTQQAISTLGVDAVVVGKVKKFNLLHAGIYAEISMTVELSLVNASDEVLWETTENVTTRAGGVSTSPWGLLLNAATATLHLSEKNMLAAADELGRSLAVQIPQPSGYQGSNGPIIEQVLHDGSSTILNYGDKIKLGLKGEPGQRASISIDGLQSFDIPEVEPGVYVKEIPINATWNKDLVMIIGRLTDSKGVVSTLISSAGLVTFDNTPPQPPVGLSLSNGANSHTLSWQNADNDSSRYAAYIVKDSKRTLIGESDERTLRITDLPVFSDVRIELEAMDIAGNRSEPAVINQRIYPVAGAAQATLPSANIDSALTGDILLSASHSPYKLSVPLTVSSQNSLYVEPGVEILVTQGGNINIEGNAWFWGHDKGIRIYANTNQAPDEFVTVNSANGNVSLENVSFENGDVGVSISSGEATFNKVSFKNNQYNSVIISGTAAPTFTEGTFEGSNSAGVIVSDYAKPIFKNSIFKNNRPFHIQSSAVYPVSAKDNQWEPAASPRTILGEVTY